MEGLRNSKLEKGQQWGKNTSSKDKVEWGRRPPYIVGGTIQPLPPTPAPQRAVLPLGQWYYPPPLRYCRWGQSGTTAVVRAVLLHTSGTTAPTAAASTQNPTRKKTPRIKAVLARDRSGTTAGGYQRYYRSRAVLPLVAPKQYYRSGPRYYR